VNDRLNPNPVHLTRVSGANSEHSAQDVSWVETLDGLSGTLRAEWLVRLRWVAIFGQLAVAIPAVRTGWLNRTHLLWYLSCVAGLTVFNILARSRLEAQQENSIVVLLHLAVDLTVLAVLLILSGGVYNPMAPIVLLHASLGAMLFRGVWSLIAAGMLFSLIAVTTIFPVLPTAVGTPNVQPLVQGSALTIVAATIWVLTTWFANILRQHRVLVEQLRLGRDRLDRLRATGVLAAGFCHELATPLNTIGLRLERMKQRDDGNDPDLKIASESLAQCESALRAMIGSTLEASELRFESTVLVPFVERICSEWSGTDRVADFRSEISKTGRSEIPRLVLAQTVIDLLDNAGHAHAVIGSEQSIEVNLTEMGTFLCIEVQDRGTGVPQSIRHNVGQPFVTTKVSGTGLGLYNAKNLCLALGGDLDIEDRVGGGTLVRIRVSQESIEWGHSV
jgi:two-component system sensor histidine kinase RegB